MSPSSPLGYANDIAKPYHIYVKQRSCVDVNSPINEGAELTQVSLVNDQPKLNINETAIVQKSVEPVLPKREAAVTQG
jgi:hypothetical protein